MQKTGQQEAQVISTDTNALREAIARARLLAERSVMPIYSNVMLHARPENAWLTITAGSPDAQIALDVDSDIDEALSICVDAERLSLALNVPGEKTKISMEGERVKIATGKSVFRLPHIEAKNFPLLLSQGDKIAAFECAWLGDDLKRVLPFTGSADHLILYCRGVSLRCLEGKLKIEGTNHAICASLEREIAWDANFSVMLPARSCEVIAAINPTRAILKHGTALFLGENVQLTSVYLQAQLLDLARVFPPDGSGAIVVDRKEFIDTVKAISAVSDAILKRTRPVRVTTDGAGTMAIEALGQSGDGRAEIAAEGPKLDGNFDAAFLASLAGAGESRLMLVPDQSPQRLSTFNGKLRAVITSLRV